MAAPIQQDITLGTAGHIDHGKTALVGALSGIQTDRLQEEQQRGISIDLGFAHLQLEDEGVTRTIGIVDVPGHERFVRNMLAGASGIDVALLVVAADDSVMPQTREHLAILELLQIPRGLIAITKCDLAEASWLDLVEEDVRELVAGTFLADAPIVRTSATTGAGLEQLRQSIAEVCQAVDARPDDEPFRLSIDRAFVVQGLGTVVTGTVGSGRLGVGEDVQWWPSGKMVRVRSLQCHGQAAEEVRRGQRAALNLMGVHHQDVQRGHVLAQEGYLRDSRRVTVSLRVLPESPWPVRHRSDVRLHVGTHEVMARVWLLEDQSIEPGQRAMTQLITAEPVSVVAGQPFVVRAVSPLRTLGGGKILQPCGVALSRKQGQDIAHLADLQDASPLTRLAAAVYFGGGQSMETLDLCRDAGVTPQEAEAGLSQLQQQGETRVFTVNRRTLVVHELAMRQWTDRVSSVMERLHLRYRLQPSIPRQRLASWLKDLDQDLLGALVDHMVEQGQLIAHDTGVTLPGFEPVLTQAQQQTRTAILASYKSAAFSPPDQNELAKQANVPEDQLRPIIELCVSQGQLAHLDGGLCLHADWEQELRRRVREGLQDGSGLTMSDIRDLLQTSRKYAVPMCEYLDRVGLTVRRGDVRVLNDSASDTPAVR